MWVAEFKINGKNALLGELSAKHSIRIVGYPISSFEKQKEIYVFFVAFLFGSEKQKGQFIKDLKQKVRVVDVENHNHFIVAQIKEDKKASVMYNHKILYVKPVEIFPDGTEKWTIASWDKEELIRISDFHIQHFDGTLLRIENMPIKNFSMLSINPAITEKQNRAMILAVENGYYECPRQITLDKLAERMGISFSTYQAHLRKAEKKVLPFVFKKMI